MPSLTFVDIRREADAWQFRISRDSEQHIQIYLVAHDWCADFTTSEDDSEADIE
jgi:hypothetical protein